MVDRQLGMERGGHHAILAHEHRIAPVAGEHLHVRPRRLDSGSPDEHAVKRRPVEPGDIEVGLEAVELAAVAVALHGDVEGAEVPLVGSPVVDLLGEQDQPGTRAEHRQTIGDARADLVEQAARREQIRHRRALATRHDEPVDAEQIPRLADVARRDVELSEPAPVGGEGPLQCEYADQHLAHRAPDRS